MREPAPSPLSSWRPQSRRVPRRREPWAAIPVASRSHAYQYSSFLCRDDLGWFERFVVVIIGDDDFRPTRVDGFPDERRELRELVIGKCSGDLKEAVAVG